MGKFDPADASQAEFDAQIEGLEQMLEEQTAAVEITRDRLQWIRQGRLLYVDSIDDRDDDNAIASAPAVAGDKAAVVGSGAGSTNAQTKGTADLSKVVSPYRSGLNGRKPTLRQAILITLLERAPEADEEHEWLAKEIIIRLRREDWISERKSADRSVRKMLRDMVSHAQLDYPRYATYRLPENARAGGAGAEP